MKQFKEGDFVYVLENDQPHINWTGTVKSYDGRGFYSVINADGVVKMVKDYQLEAV